MKMVILSRSDYLKKKGHKIVFGKKQNFEAIR